MLKRKSRTLAINAVFLGLLLATSFMTLIPVAGVGSALLPLVVLVVASQIEGYKTSLFLGLSFGIMSLIISYINPSPLAPIFRNPLVSVLPRIFIAFLGFVIYTLTRRLISKIAEHRQGKGIDNRIITLISSALGSAFTVFFNTLFVLLMIYFLYFGKQVGGTAISTEFIMGLISINFVIEIVGTTIVTPPIVLVVSKFVENLKMTVADADIIDECDADMPMIVTDAPEQSEINSVDKDTQDTANDADTPQS